MPLSQTPNTISTIQHAVAVADALPSHLFRGHGRRYEEPLTPRAFRSYSNSGPVGPSISAIEHGRYEMFKLWSPSVSSELPREDEDLEWIFLMQHHGLPTRLLDWTWSSLVALYFAVEDRGDDKHDGELWGMHPQFLNAASELFGLGVAGDTEVDHLVQQVQHQEAWHDPRLRPLAVVPPTSSVRMAAQQSAFTIHPTPPAQGIDDVLNQESMLCRYVIPRENKRDLFLVLDNLGITRHMLFADLDALAMTVTTRANRVPKGLSDPPKCGGPWVEPVGE